MQNVETIKQHIGRNGDRTASDSSNVRRKISLSSMVKAVDKKVAESITLSKGTLWLIGVGFLVIQLLFNYGGTAISWARNDQTNVEAIKALRDQMAADKSSLNDKIDSMKQQFLDKNTETRDDVKDLKNDFTKIKDGFADMKSQNDRLFGAKVKNLAEQP